MGKGEASDYVEPEDPDKLILGQHLLMEVDNGQDEAIDKEGIIDDFLQAGDQRILIQKENSDTPPTETLPSDTEDDENEILTERLAHIYIKQGKFEKAIEIIQRLSLKYPKKNRYFADQIRFLGKLVINSKNIK